MPNDQERDEDRSNISKVQVFMWKSPGASSRHVPIRSLGSPARVSIQHTPAERALGGSRGAGHAGVYGSQRSLGQTAVRTRYHGRVKSYGEASLEGPP